MRDGTRVTLNDPSLQGRPRDCRRDFRRRALTLCIARKRRRSASLLRLLVSNSFNLRLISMIGYLKPQQRVLRGGLPLSGMAAAAS